MRKMSLILGLVAVTVFASASEAFAQRIQIGGRRGGGISIGSGAGYNGSGYGYGSGFGYGSGYYGSNNYGGRGNYYGSQPFYGNRGYYYDTVPQYYYADPVTQYAPMAVRQANYSDPNSATITVVVSDANAQVWFDDSPTAQRGNERWFYTPALQQRGTYTIKARWSENGRTIDQQRQVTVQPGQSATVDFRSERVLSPK